MQNSIWKGENSVIKITHWNHFYVNRNTGFTSNNYCTYEVLLGEGRGGIYSSPCAYVTKNFSRAYEG